MTTHALVFEDLTPEERGRREELVEIIVVGEVASLRSGKALREVRDRRLYRETHTNLEAWAHDACRLSRARVYQLIEFADVHEAAADQGIEVSNERMARALGVISPEHYGLVVAVTQAATGKDRPSNADLQAVGEVVRDMAAGMVEHPDTREPMPFADLPPERKAEAVTRAVQAGSRDRRDFQGTDDVKPMEYLSGLQQMGVTGALRFGPPGYWLEVMDASTGELLEGPPAATVWDAPRAWRRRHESELDRPGDA
ncbi:hypothetical protein [Deinococcus aquiradiocola]|uniref:hypothetical protein n=1 Tax=Deinococcus aquiradiocola TaxID=393059 RepID=UPI001662DB40|nr:hypothetical protein [Deinococcus aquiradiocola]